MERDFAAAASEAASLMPPSSLPMSTRDSQMQRDPGQPISPYSTRSPRMISSPRTQKRMYPKPAKPDHDRPQLFTPGQILRDRWVIKEMIGRGGYGQIYFVHDKKLGESVALKVEPTHRIDKHGDVEKKKLLRRMILEQRVLLRLQGRPHVPLMYASGAERHINYIVMQLLSVNVADLRKQSPFRRLSKKTCGRIMIQAIAALRDMHKAGFLHRDVKPGNMCFGLTEHTKHRLVLIDYGLVRRYKTADGRWRRRRPRAGFRGTLRYVSLRVHNHEDQGPSDDLCSLFYSLIEMIRGGLTWSQQHDTKQVKAMKKEMVADDFFKVAQHIDDTIREFGRAVTSMRADDEPNYDELQSIMSRLSDNWALNAPYDWENEYADVDAEKEINVKVVQGAA
ncbi:CK1/TTBKL protein kinase [Aphelenchoides avenae]|nr:CK1/TTBKL protein kinase [Aphelenchus avenae]